MADAKFRPVGLAEGPEGALFISDSKKGRIWKVTFDRDKDAFGIRDRIVVERRKARSHLRTPDEKRDLLPQK